MVSVSLNDVLVSLMVVWEQFEPFSIGTKETSVLVKLEQKPDLLIRLTRFLCKTYKSMYQNSLVSRVNSLMEVIG